MDFSFGSAHILSPSGTRHDIRTEGEVRRCEKYSEKNLQQGCAGEMH